MAYGSVNVPGVTAAELEAVKATVKTAQQTADAAKSAAEGAQAKATSADSLATFVIVNGTDLNTLKGTQYWGRFGFAGGGNTDLNKPSGVNAFGLLILRAATGYTAQILIDATGNSAWVRTGNDTGDWGAWKKVAPLTNTDVGAAAASHTHQGSDIKGAVASATAATTATSATTAGALKVTLKDMDTDDWNTVTTAGMYYTGQVPNGPNKPPVTCGGLFRVDVYSTSIYQEYIQAEPPAVYRRRRKATEWNNWVLIGPVTTAGKLGTKTVGSATIPIYLDAGVPKQVTKVGAATTADTATKLGANTVGSSTLPIYLNAGTPTQISKVAAAATADTATKLGTGTVGSASIPIYLNAGTPTQVTKVASATAADTATKLGSKDVGTVSKPIYLKLGVPTVATGVAVTGHKHTTADITGFPTSMKPTAHAMSDTTYGAGTSTNYGHVKLSDATNSTSGASAGIAATPTAVKSAYDLANKAQTAANGKLAKPKVLTLTLNTTWTEKAQTVTATGVVATETSQLVIVCPAQASAKAYMDAGVYCSKQAQDSLTFTCSTVPTSVLTVYAVLLALT